MMMHLSQNTFRNKRIIPVDDSCQLAAYMDTLHIFSYFKCNFVAIKWWASDIIAAFKKKKSKKKKSQLNKEKPMKKQLPSSRMQPVV